MLIQILFSLVLLQEPAHGLRLRIPSLFAAKERSREELTSGIAGFYDRSSGLWESMWGEHMHHGYYPADEPAPKTMADHQAAQIRMIDRVLDWASEVSGSPESEDGAWHPKRVLDVGCGIGGSTRHIAKRFAGSVLEGTGITLSPFQRERAEILTSKATLHDKLSFRVQNALEMPMEWQNKYDIVWSLESGEHMPDKPAFVKELCRVAAPGGRIIIVTWCHRDLQLASQTTLVDEDADDDTAASFALKQTTAALAEEEAWPAVVEAGVGVELQPLSSKEERLLARINRAYYLPRWCSVADYVKLLEAEGCTNVRRADWTPEIASFWPAVIKSSLTLRGLFGLARSGFTTIRGAVAMLLMVKGYREGLIVFGLITAEAPKIGTEDSIRGEG